MTMHLAHPALTTTGKRKSKIKFRNSEQAKKARELDQSWKELQKKWGIDTEERKRKRALSAPVMLPTQHAPYRRDTGPAIPSKNPTDMSPCTKKEQNVYTGTNMIGIGTLHKSNAVPVFSQDDAIEISRMRRG